MSFFTVTQQTHYFFPWNIKDVINKKVAILQDCVGLALVANFNNVNDNFGYWANANDYLIETAELLGCILRDVDYEDTGAYKSMWKKPVRVVFEKNGEILTITEKNGKIKWKIEKLKHNGPSKHTSKAIREKTHMGCDCDCKECERLRKKYFPHVKIAKGPDKYVDCPYTNPYM